MREEGIGSIALQIMRDPRATIVVVLGCGIAIAGHQANLRSFEWVAAWSPLIATVAALSAAALLVQVGAVLLGCLSDHRLASGAMQTLSALSKSERRLVAFCVADGQQSLVYPRSSAAASTLMQRRLVVPRAGPYELHKWVFVIPDQVWAALRKKKWQAVLEPELSEARKGSEWARRLRRVQADAHSWDMDETERLLAL